MSYNHDYKIKVLYEDKKKKEISDKLQKVQKSFNLLDKGLITSDKFLNTIKNEFDEKISDKLVRIIKNQNYELQNFRTVLKNLNVLKDDKTEYRQQSSKINNKNQINKVNRDAKNNPKKSKFIVFNIRSWFC